MSHLQRILREQEATKAELTELRRQLATIERQIQNIASDSFGGDIGESGNLFFRPGEIRVGSVLKIDKSGFIFNSITTGGVFVLDVNEDIVSFGGALRIKERSEAMGDAATWGQLWVKNTSPMELWFTDEDGADYRVDLTAMGGIHMIEEKDDLIVGEPITVTKDPFEISEADALNIGEDVTVSGLRVISESDNITVGEAITVAIV